LAVDFVMDGAYPPTLSFPSLSFLSQKLFSSHLPFPFLIFLLVRIVSQTAVLNRDLAALKKRKYSELIIRALVHISYLLLYITQWPIWRMATIR